MKRETGKNSNNDSPIPRIPMRVGLEYLYFLASINFSLRALDRILSTPNRELAVKALVVPGIALGATIGSMVLDGAYYREMFKSAFRH